MPSGLMKWRQGSRKRIARTNANHGQHRQPQQTAISIKQAGYMPSLIVRIANLAMLAVNHRLHCVSSGLASIAMTKQHNIVNPRRSCQDQ